MDWQDEAVCREIGGDIFYPDVGDPNENGRYTAKSFGEWKQAKAVCRGCPVRAECLKYSLEMGEYVFGVWGGLSPSERQGLTKKMKALPVETIRTWLDDHDKKGRR